MRSFLIMSRAIRTVRIHSKKVVIHLLFFVQRLEKLAGNVHVVLDHIVYSMGNNDIECEIYQMLHVCVNRGKLTAACANLISGLILN